jgi:hypothetical protein
MGTLALVMAILMGSTMLVRAVMLMRTIQPARILVMPHDHALRRGDRGYALQRNGQGQQRGDKNPGQAFRHCGDYTAAV